MATTRAAATTSPARKSAAKTTAAKKTTAKKSAAKKTTAKKSPAKKTTAKKTAAKTSPARKTAAKKSAAKTTAAKQSRTTRSAAAGGTPDVLSVLMGDHELVNDLFDEFEALSRRAHKAREQLVRRIVEELSVHASIEETVFYPAVRDRLGASDESMVLEALEEHHLVKLTLSELQSMSSDSERFDAKVTVLREVVDHHVDEEENDLFPKVRRAFSDEDLVEMAQHVNQARSAAPTRAHPSAPDTPPGNLVANVLTAPLDAATNLSQRAADAVRDAID